MTATFAQVVKFVGMASIVFLSEQYTSRPRSDIHGDRPDTVPSCGSWLRSPAGNGRPYAAVQSPGRVPWYGCEPVGNQDSAVKRRTFVIVSTVNPLAAAVSSAQEPAKNSRLGIITSSGNPRSAAFFAAFEDRLRELGWVDGEIGEAGADWFRL